MKAPQPERDTITQRELILGSWYTRHRIHLGRIGMGVLWTLATVSVLIFLVTMLNWLAHRDQTRQIEQQLPTSLINFDRLTTVLPLQITSSQAVRRSADLVDVVVEVYNPNPTKAAFPVQIDISVGGKTLNARSITLAPQQRRYVVETRLKNSGSTLPTVTAQLHDVHWEQITDPASSFQSYVWEFTSANLSYVDTPTGAESQITLDLGNPTPYNAVEPEVIIRVLNADGSIGAIDRLVLDRIPPESTTALTVAWPTRLAGSAETFADVQIDFSRNRTH